MYTCIRVVNNTYAYERAPAVTMTIFTCICNVIMVDQNIILVDQIVILVDQNICLVDQNNILVDQIVIPPFM